MHNKLPPRKKISVLICQDLRLIGGVTRYIESLSENLVKLGHQVHVVEGSYDSEVIVNEFYQQKNIKYFTYKIEKSGTILEYFSAIVLSKKKIQSLLEVNSYDLIHCHSILPYIGLLGSRTLKKTPIIYHFHGPVFIETLYSLITSSCNKTNLLKIYWNAFKILPVVIIEYIFQMICIHDADSVICLSKYSQNIINKYFFTKKYVHIIPGGVDKNQYYPQRHKYSTKIMKSKGLQQILYVGRLEPRKGVSLLLKAISLLKQKGETYHLTIAHPNNQIEKTHLLNNLKLINDLGIKENISIVNNPSLLQRRQLYQSSECLIMPSKQLETFGIVILEAFASKTPVLGTNVGAIPEILKKIDNQLIIEKQTAQGIANKLLWLNQLETDKKVLIINKGYNVICKEYTWKIVTQKIESIYQKNIVAHY